MKELIPMDAYGVFADTHDTARVSSLVLAEMFGKKHKNVLQAIENLDCSEEFCRLNFAPSSYINEENKGGAFAPPAYPRPYSIEIPTYETKTAPTACNIVPNKVGSPFPLR